MAGLSPTRALRSGTALKRTGAALIAVAMIFNFAMAVVPWRVLQSDPAPFDDWIQRTVFITFVLGLIIPGGAFLIWRGRQYDAQATAERIITDSKAHLLYLRAFRSDPSTWRQVFWNVHDISKLLLGLASEEEQLAEVLQPFGELIAIGRPGESLPTPGAARIYTSDEEWKDVVKHQIQAAQLVVIRAAAGENVFWELTQAVKILNPQKLLILLLNMKVADYESFRTKANSLLDVPLPESKRLQKYWRVSGFIGFASDWKPSFFALKAPFFRSGSFKRLFKYALKPVFENFGLEWQAPPVSRLRVFIIASPFLLLLVLYLLLLYLTADIPTNQSLVANFKPDVILKT
jgi:hypothetical protein